MGTLNEVKQGNTLLEPTLTLALPPHGVVQLQVLSVSLHGSLGRFQTFLSL